jgi:hypothetical protein
MALVVADRVWETTSTSGTGTLTLSGALSGYQTFAVIGNGNTTYYTITNGTDWEVGIGTYTSSGTTLSRDTVLSSSLGGSKINVTPGSFVFVDYPAGRSVYEDESGVVTGYPISGGTINNTPIGATTPNTGIFSLISSTRINPRVTSIASGSTITPTADTADQYNVTALAVPATIAIPSGTPVDGQKLVIRIEDDGTARALTWTTTAGGYRVIGSTLPTTTVATKNLYVGCIYNSAESFWDVVAVAQQV